MNNQPEKISITAEEMDYLRRFFETDSHKFIFEKAVTLLYDVVKAHELNWDMSFSRTITNENGQRAFDEAAKNPRVLLFPISRLSEEGLRINHEQFKKLNASSN